jgi:penicillin-binding protein 1B
MPIEITSIREKRRLPRLRRDAFRKMREQSARTRRRTRVLQAAGLLFIALVSTGLVTFVYLYTSYSKLVDERLASGYLTSRAGIYAAPRTLRKGQGISRERLAGLLRRAGYVEAEAANAESAVWSGRFIEGDDFIEVEPRRSTVTGGRSAFGAVRVEFVRGGRVGKIRGDGVEIDSFTLEAEPLSQDASMKTAERPALSFEDLPPTLVRAVLAIEDRRFFEHNGVDAVGIVRAALSWGDSDQDLKQGGSTITQQLVKNTYLTPERTISRKVNEAVLATVLERRLSKQDIFALYCNEIYLGQRGSLAVRGVEQAARVYFGKALKDLSLAESATIAGMIQSPGRYAPDRRPERARLRRNTVIDAMLRDGAVTQEEAEAASDEPVAVVPADHRDATAPYFIDYVNRLVESRADADEKDAAGHLRVQTTIDLELQRVAEETVRGQLDRLEKVFKGKRRPEAALVALDPHTGHVLAMVGGRSYADSQLNRATDARRQPGSVFKPVVYAAAIEHGISPVSLALDAPREFSYDLRSAYKPANYGGGYSMRDVTLRDGLVRSLNVVTVDAAVRTGLSRVADYAARLGLPRPEPYPSLALGTTEATPLEVASAYAAFANGGALVRPTALTTYGDANDSSALRASASDERRALKPTTSYMITDMLEAVVERGTARAARGALRGVAFAGKTGTSRDGWFAGYTPNLVCVVWVGFDDNEQLGLTGADSALPAWVEFMRAATELRPELGGESFARPAGLTTVEIDPESGMLASPSCKSRERIAITHALAPAAECFMHQEAYGALAGLSGGEYYSDYVAADMVSPGASAEEEKTEEPAPVRAPQLPALPTDTTEVEPIRPATRVERGRNGRPVLTNEVRVPSAGAAWKGGWDRCRLAGEKVVWAGEGRDA